MYHDNRANHWIRGCPGEKTKTKDTLLAFFSLWSNMTSIISAVAIVLYPTCTLSINGNRLANCARLANVECSHQWVWLKKKGKFCMATSNEHLCIQIKSDWYYLSFFTKSAAVSPISQAMINTWIINHHLKVVCERLETFFLLLLITERKWFSAFFKV